MVINVLLKEINQYALITITSHLLTGISTSEMEMNNTLRTNTNRPNPTSPNKSKTSLLDLFHHVTHVQYYPWKILKLYIYFFQFLV